MAEIVIPQKPNKKPDVYDYGFDKSLTRPVKQDTSALVYDIINERLSQLIPAGQQITNVLPGLLIEKTNV